MVDIVVELMLQVSFPCQFIFPLLLDLDVLADILYDHQQIVGVLVGFVASHHHVNLKDLCAALVDDMAQLLAGEMIVEVHLPTHRYTVQRFDVILFEFEKCTERGRLADDVFLVALEEAACLFVDIGELSFCVEHDDADRRTVEDGLVANESLFGILLHAEFVGNVFLRAKNDNRVAFLVALQDGELYLEVVFLIVACFGIHRLDVKRSLLVGDAPVYELLDDTHQTVEVARVVAVGEFFSRIGDIVHAVAIIPVEGLGVDVVGPHSYAAGFKNQRHTLVLQVVGLGKLPVFATEVV